MMLDAPRSSVAPVKWIYEFPRNESETSPLCPDSVHKIWVSGDYAVASDGRFSLVLLNANSGEVVMATNTNPVFEGRYLDDKKYDARVFPHPDGIHFYWLRCSFSLSNLSSFPLFAFLYFSFFFFFFFCFLAMSDAFN
jgi:hypothetical protein